jgi:phage gp29-like protein
VFAQYQKIMRNMHIGAESGLILPQVLDDKGEQYFKFEVVNVSGSKSYDVAAVIESYKMEILTALYATVLTAGQGGGGSFALSTSLQEMVDMIIEAKLEEMRDVFNHTLIPYLWKLNGWDMTVLPTFEFTDISEPNIDDYSKAIQRIGAVKLIARTARNVNAMAEKLGLPDRIPEDATREQIDEILGTPPEDTKAGQGMEEGNNSGTGKADGSSGDGSTSNTENK